MSDRWRTAKTTCLVGGMLADADSIEDLELLRHGGVGRLFGEIRAPSTLGDKLIIAVDDDNVWQMISKRVA